MLRSKLHNTGQLIAAVLTLVVLTTTAVACSQPTPTAEQAVETPTLAATDTAEPAAPEATMPSAPTATPAVAEASFEGVRFDLDEAVATSAAAEMVKVTQADGGPWWLAEPQHIVFALQGYPLQDTFHDPRIIVYPVHAFETMNENAAQQIAQLQNLLGERPAQVAGNLPFLPLFNAGQVTHAAVNYLDFQDGSGVRFLTQYSQVAGPINNNELFYTFQGLTDDGEYYVAAILPAAHPDLPADFSATPPNFPEPGDSSEAFQTAYQNYLDQVVQQLNAAEPASFTPDLMALDAMIQSLSVSGADFAEAAAAAAPTRPQGEAPANVVNTFYTWLLNHYRGTPAIPSPTAPIAGALT